MKPGLLLSLFLFFTVASFGQKTELHANAYSGLFFFRGSGATSSSTVFVGDDLGYFNPTSYGKKSDFSYSLELQMQRVTKQNHLYGIGVGFERLSSRAGVDSTDITFIGRHPATGKVTLKNDFVTASPYIGQRFQTGLLTFDLQAGIDFAFSTRVFDQAKITSEGYVYGVNKAKHPVDFRPRVQVNSYYKGIGFSAGYSVGLTNLYSYDNPNYANRKAYANYMRVGVSYLLK